MEEINQLVRRANRILQQLESCVEGSINTPDWAAAIAYRYRKRTLGVFGVRAFIEPILQPALLPLEALQGIDEQKQRLLQNTAQFVAGGLANHALLTGARGTGKSSLIKACLQHFSAQGLRLIEVDKTDLTDLHDITQLLISRPEKYIIYCDDLSFDDAEYDYKSLKSVLDGSVAGVVPNVLVYATSNRRHLVPEYFKDNEPSQYNGAAEVHPSEAVEEKIALSERFGLWIGFYPCSQDDYLTMVQYWLLHFGLHNVAYESIKQQALLWSLERGARSGRVAWQFARAYVGGHSTT